MIPVFYSRQTQTGATHKRLMVSVMVLSESDLTKHLIINILNRYSIPAGTPYTRSSKFPPVRYNPISTSYYPISRPCAFAFVR